MVQDVFLVGGMANAPVFAPMSSNTAHGEMMEEILERISPEHHGCLNAWSLIPDLLQNWSLQILSSVRVRR
jgi:hypothetical protein